MNDPIFVKYKTQRLYERAKATGGAIRTGKNKKHKRIRQTCDKGDSVLFCIFHSCFYFRVPLAMFLQLYFV